MTYITLHYLYFEARNIIDIEDLDHSLSEPFWYLPPI